MQQTMKKFAYTPDSKEVKQTLKAQGIDVKRSVIFNGKLTVTVALNDADKTEYYLMAHTNLRCQRLHMPPLTARACRIPMLGVAEFTSLINAPL